MKYRVLLFDADETLLDFKANEAHALPAVFAKHQLPFDEQLRNDYLQINQRLWRELEQGKKTSEQVMVQRFEELFEKYQISIDPKQFSEDYMAILSKGAYPNENALEVLKQLSKQHRLVVVTNGFSRSQHYRLKHSGIAQYLEQIFVSEEVGHRKPSKELMDVILKALQVEKTDCLMIGDCFETDMEFGIRNQVDTCWYRSDGIFDERKALVNYTITDLRALLKEE